MPQKRYKLDPKANAFIKGGLFSCRIGYEKTNPDGTKTLISQKSMPVVQLSNTDIVATTNAWAQKNIENFAVPCKTKRNHTPSGLTGEHCFDDVTATTTETDVTLNLDSIFV